MTVEPQAQITEYVFRAPWGGGNDAWIEAINKHNPSASKFLEIGSYEGRSAVYFFDKVFKDGRTYELYCLDTWLGGEGQDTRPGQMELTERIFDHNINIAIRNNPAKKVSVTKIKNSSLMGLANLITMGHCSTFDFVYVDGSHQCPDVIGDLVSSFHLLRPSGGIMVCDDYTWFPDHRVDRLLHSPKMAIDSFGNIFWDKLAWVQMSTPHQPMFVKL